MVTTLGKVIVSAQIDKTQLQELRRLAAEGDRSLSAEVRRAVNSHLERAPHDREERTT